MNDILITMDDGSTQELSHHGVKGMKWGVRNAETQRKYAGSDRKTAKQNWKDTKRVAKRLNKLDSARAIDIGRMSTARQGVQNATKAYNKAAKKGNEKKMAKMNEKVNKYSSNYSDAQKRIAGYSKEAQKLGKSVANNGYHIQVSRCARSTLTTGQKAAMVALVTLQSASGANVVFYSDPRILGDKYKAAKKKPTKKGAEYLHGDRIKTVK